MILSHLFFLIFFIATLQYIPVFSETLGNTLTLLLFTCYSILIMIFTIFFLRFVKNNLFTLTLSEICQLMPPLISFPIKRPTGVFKRNPKLEHFTVNITVTCNPTILFLAISVATLILS